MENKALAVNSLAGVMGTKMRKFVQGACGVSAMAIASAIQAAAPVVTFNTSNLLPNTPNQVIQVLIQGTDLISGENLNFQIYDNGSGTSFTSVDVVSGTIFASNHQPPTGPGLVTSGPNGGRVALISLTTVSDFVGENGLLATLLVSTTAASSGTFNLDMLNTVNGVSNVVLPNPSNTNNAITLAIQFPHSHISIGSAVRQWTVNGGGTWDTDSHWTPFAPYAQGDIASFLGALTSGTASITLDGDRTIGSLVFNDSSGSYNLAPGIGGILHLSNGTAAPLISNLVGTHTISAPMVLTASTTVSVSGGSTLTISGGISGSALSGSGSGLLVVTGTNNSPSGINVAAGASLQVGAGAIGGSLGSAPVTVNGQLTYVGSSPLIASPLSGPGGITFTSNNSPAHLSSVDVASSTTITSTGSLQVDAGGILAGGTVTNSGLLRFARIDSASHSSPIAGTGTLTQSGIGTTTLTGAYTATGPIDVNAGKLAFGTTAGTRQTPAVLVEASALSVSSTLDMSNHDMLIHSGSATAFETKLKSAYDFGLWDLPGITSKTAAGSSGLTTLGIMSGSDYNTFSPNTGSFDGKPVASTDTIVKYTYAGDFNLDGLVDDNDLFLFLATYLGSQVGNYAQGDANYDGVVDDNDVFLFLANYLNQPTQPLGGSSLASAPVPEPGTLAVLGLGIMGIASMRGLRKDRRAS